LEIRFAPAVSSWCATQPSSISSVGSQTVRPFSRMWRMHPLIHSVCCWRQVVMLQSAADGASGVAVVNRFG
jgi:hypothetical protein